MFGAVALGVALVAVSSRSERAMFQSGISMPGVFATIGTDLTENPRISLRDRDPSAFFARLDPGVDDPAPEPEEDGGIAPLERALLFIGPDAELPAPGPIEIQPLGDTQGPQLAYSPDASPPPQPGDSPFFRQPQGTNLPNTPDDTIPIVTPPPVATPVPEPATWAMLLVGFMAVGAALRIRRNAVSPQNFSR